MWSELQVVRNSVIGILLASVRLVELFLLNCGSNSEEMEGRLYEQDREWVMNELKNLMSYLEDVKVERIQNEKKELM